MSGYRGRVRSLSARNGNAGSSANWRSQKTHDFQRPRGLNRGREGEGPNERNQRNIRASLPITWNHLTAIVSREDADQLLITLSTKPGWQLLLESDFQSYELRAIFAALRKCSEASSLDLLRRFMRKSLCIDKFESRCCLLLGALGPQDFRIAEDVVSVLEASAWLQPAGLAKTCMILLVSLEGNRSMSSWSLASRMDFSEKLKATREQFLEAAKANNASRVATQSAPKIFKGYRTSGTASNSFREMSILPSKEDLEEEHPFLRPNIVEGAYESLDDYLDVQFRLLREDYVTPLRDGLREFKGMGSEFCRWKLRSIQDVRFYSGVFYQRPQESNSVLAIRERIILLLAPEDYKHVNWIRSKRFTNGALIGISKDKFETIIFATVSNRDPEALRQSGALTLELCFDEDIVEFKPDIEFSLVESSGAYFEAYRHNLAVLQSMTEMPLSRNLVFAKKDVQPPSLLSSIEWIDLKPIMKDSTPHQIYSKYSWPLPEDTILNVRQHEAIVSAFTNELCVIQGPPGTGKTFVGLKIVELMLRNELTEKPLLIVCYTNHALDQFVEGISKFTKDIVRLGGRCGSDELEQYTLRALRRRTQGRMTHDGFLAKRQKLQRLLWDLRDERRILTQTLEKIEYHLAALQGRAIFKHCSSLGSNLDKKLQLDYIDRYVMQDEEEVDEDALEDDGNLSDEDRGEVEDEDIAVQTKCNTRKEAAIKKLLGSHKQPNDQSLPYTKYKFMRRRQFLAEMRERGNLDGWTEWIQNDPAQPPRFEVPAHLELALEEWWQLYREVHWLEAIQFARGYLRDCHGMPESTSLYVSTTTIEELRPAVEDDIEWAIRCLTSRLIDIRRELLQNLKEFGEAESLLDFEIIKNCKIIGVTTTGAAKYNALLRKVQYQVVVVEEAAEVLEAHLITTLSPSTKQLILIGDHQQLQPSTTVYKLATSFNLQISLFERLINNGISYVRLQEQHRMRDQFLKLLVPTIYADYYSHKSVLQYENIRGLSQNLFFVTHENSEEAEKENSSKSNLFEAEFVTCLALYLRMQGYAPSQIVILTTYSGQVFAIRNFIRDIEEDRHWTGMKTVIGKEGEKSRVKVKEGLPISMFEGIRITTVDNYQGEESEIVIASFVRSNDDQRIGFLSKDNRVCVALSRAKKGFYCIGNIAMLASKSRTWENISRVLLEENAVNKGLELYCDIHDFRLMAVSPRDFNEFSDGGCPKPCGLRLSCGHVCPKSCHKLDPDHAEFSCQRDCERSRVCGHACSLRCFQDCGRCFTKVIKRLPCGHDASTRCHIPPEEIECKVVVKKLLSKCSHDADLECSFPVESYACPKPCERFMPCQVHRCEKKCSTSCGKCMTYVEALSSCGHTVRLQCRDSKDPKSLLDACDTKVEVRLSCGHMNQVPCQERELAQILSDQCQQPTEVTCSSGHSFTVKCPIARSGKTDDYCRKKVSVVLECGHEIIRECRQAREVDRASLAAQCRQMVEVRASCGHDVLIPCKEKAVRPSSALRDFCSKPIEETLACGHERTRKCNEISACTAPFTVKSSCGHDVVTLCSKKDDAEFTRTRCRAKCGTILQCQHPCSETCCDCRKERFHQKCVEKCNQTLFCGHRCYSKCHSQCNPCLVKEKISCPHNVREAECMSSINEPCTKKPQHCAHKKCDALECAKCHCSCDSHCQKNLPCAKPKGRRKGKPGNHKCVGLCSELCVCSSCDDGKIRVAKLPHGVNWKAARFIKLPCSHLFEVSWLDNFMAGHKDFLSFPKCPECGAQIRLVRRYHELLERIRLNMREVYKRVFGDFNEIREEYHEFFKKCQETDRRDELMNMAHQFSKTPSRYVLDYLEALFLLTDEDYDLCAKAIRSEELQLQLLSDCFEATCGDTLVGTTRRRPDILKAKPVRVDRWKACDQNHVFSAADHENCPDCPSPVDAIAGSLAQVSVGDQP